uniref:Uncharacterized protein n=1 Tax=Anguilla anguilla TaxID=7936 RepID=A0A0E9SWX2_ANGAN
MPPFETLALQMLQVAVGLLLDSTFVYVPHSRHHS